MNWAVLILGGMAIGLLYQNYRDTCHIYMLEKQVARFCRGWSQQMRRDDTAVSCLREIADGSASAADKARACLRELGEMTASDGEEEAKP